MTTYAILPARRRRRRRPRPSPTPAQPAARTPNRPRPVGDSTALLDTLAAPRRRVRLDELPEVVLVHERIGPVPALELIREVALRFPAVGVVLSPPTPSPGLSSPPPWTPARAASSRCR